MLTLEILIPTAWLIVIGFVVAMCSVSARSDHEAATGPADGWIKVGAPGFRGGVQETRASGESGWGRRRSCWSESPGPGRPQCAAGVGTSIPRMSPHPRGLLVTSSTKRLSIRA